MTDVTAYLTNTAFGYPRGAERRVVARRLVCIHATYNPNTPLATAQQERDYANRQGSNGPSAHSYLNRDGSFVHAVDPKYAAWSNGVLTSPKTAVPGVSEVVALVAGGHNANEDYYREIETCARYPDLPITTEQRGAIAEQIARDSLTTGLPIGRATVHLHSDLDSVNKGNCPVRAAQADAFVTDIIRAAREFAYLAQIEALTADVDRLQTRFDLLNEEVKNFAAHVDEALAWGTALQAFGGQILATDKPEWAP